MEGQCDYRIVLDALIPAATVLEERLDVGENPVDAFVCSSEAATSGAEASKDMRAQAGRSSDIPPDLLASVPDPSATAAAAWYKAGCCFSCEEHETLSIVITNFVICIHLSYTVPLCLLFVGEENESQPVYSPWFQPSKKLSAYVDLWNSAYR